MKFLKNWTIDLATIPAYVEFNQDFIEHVDHALANIILNSNDDRLSPESLDEFRKLVNCINPLTNELKVKYSPRKGIGRRYADCPTPTYPDGKSNPSFGKYYAGLIAMPRIIKNTLFKYQGESDYDQVKGHPTILFEIAKRNGRILAAYEDYLKPNRFDAIVAELSDFYSGDAEAPLTKKDIKWLFNKTIYGGGFNEWIKDIKSGKKKNQDGRIVEVRPAREVKNEGVLHSLYQAFYNDTQSIISLVYESNQALVDVVCAEIPNTDENQWKRKNRAMSYFCGIIENEITFQAYKFACSKGVCVKRCISWGYDGFTIQKEIPVDLLAELNAHVCAKTGLSGVKFIKKEFDNAEILEECIQTRRGSAAIEQVVPHIETGNGVHTSTIYLELKKEFEKTHFKVIESSSFFTLDDEGRVKAVRTKADFKSAYEHMPFKFITHWFTDPNMRLYESADVYPPDQICPEGIFNLWIPFEMEFVKDWVHNQEGVDAVRKHILILCGNDKVGADYFEKWIGQMIQFPSVKTICPTFISKQGAGKGRITDLFVKMFGSKKVANEITDPSRDVWGPFNSLMRDKFLINLDEATGKDSKDAQGKFKGLVKSETITINEKGQKQQIIKSFHRYLITTNGLNGAIAIHKDDRRNCVYRSSDELIGNVAYFNDLRAKFNDINVIKSVYEFFKNLPGCEAFNAIPIPHSEYHNELAELTVSPIESWLKDYTEEFYNVEGNKANNTIKLRSSACFDLFNEWKSKTRVEYEINLIKFALQLGRLDVKGIGSVKTNDGVSKGVMFKTFDLQEMHSYFKL